MAGVETALHQLLKLEEQQRDTQDMFDKLRKSLAEHRLLLEKMAEREGTQDEADAAPCSAAQNKLACRSATMESWALGTVSSSSVGRRTRFISNEKEHPSLAPGRWSDQSTSDDEDDSEDTSYEAHSSMTRAWSHLMTHVRHLSGNFLEEAAVQRAVQFKPRNCVQRCLLPLVHSILFDFLGFSMIVVGFILMALELDLLIQRAVEGEIVDLEARRVHGEPVAEWEATLRWLRSGEAFVLAWFVFEVTLRLLAEQVAFFSGPNKIWNISDLVITVLSLIYTVRDLQSAELEVSDRLRFVRIFRVIRAIHMIRMLKPFRRLRVMLYSICACLNSLAWGTFLLFLLISIAAIYFEDVALFHIQMHNRNHSEGLHHDEWKVIFAGLEENWNGMYDAQLSLLYSVTGGADWAGLAAPFCELNPIHCYAYNFWVILILFGLINITVGIFAREAQQFVQWDPRLIVEGAHSDREFTRVTLCKLFDQMDISENNVLSRREIKKGLEDPFVKAYFAQLNIDIEMNPEQFFRLLDADRNDRVDMEEFVRTCMRLQGGAKPLELQRILSEVEQVTRKVAIMHDRIENLLLLSTPR